MPTHPILIRNHLQAGAGPREVLLIHAGRVVPTSPALRYVGHFRDDDKGGLIAPAWTIGGGCGYIHASGRWVVAPELDDTRVFNEGLARYCKDGLWGFMRLDGTPAIRPRWSNVQPFHNGLAAVLVAPDTWRYIDQSGAYAFNGEFTLATPFGANGLAAARIGARDKTGYLNRSGDWAIAPRFDNALRFFADRAAPASVAAHQYGLIDASGEWIVQPDYRYIDEFNADGLAFFGRGKESWSCDTGFMDTSGQTCFHGAWSGRDNMVDGMLRDSESTWLTRHGKVYFDGMDWGGEFNEHGFAIGRNSHYGERVEGQPNPPATWGILRTDGECFAAPGNALEPLTDGDGMFDQVETNTPLAVFIGNDDDLLMLDRDARIAFRLRRESCADGQYAALYDDKARLLWTSAVGGPIDLPAPFFVAPPHTLMDKLPSLDGLIDFAKTMLADTERKLHRFAREGEIEDDGDDSEVDDDDDDDDEYDDDEDAALGRRLSTRSRIVRFYVNEELVGYYSFLAEERSNVLFRIKQDCVERLSAHFGAQDNEPDFAGRPDQTWFHAWPVSLETPLPGAADTSEANRLWLALNWSGDTGDGDEWGDLWLTCAPSLGTLERALQAFDSLCGEGDGEDQVAASAIPLTLQERIPCARISSLP